MALNKNRKKISPEEALTILKRASEALSHASYCGITGARITHTAIIGPWDELRRLILELEPDNRFVEKTSKDYVYPTMGFVELTEKS